MNVSFFCGQQNLKQDNLSKKTYHPDSVISIEEIEDTREVDEVTILIYSSGVTEI